MFHETAMDKQSEKNNLEKEVNLLDYLIVLAKYSRMIIFVSVVVPVLTYLYLLTVTIQYTAVARIVPPQQNMTLSGQLVEGLAGTMIPGRRALGGLGGFAEGLLGLKSPGDFYVGLLTSDTILDRIIKRFNLREVFKRKYQEEFRGELKNLVVIRTTKFGLISIEVTYKDPKQAADMANAFLEELSLLLREIASQEATERLAFLEKERQETSANLARAEESLRNFSEKSNVLLIDAQARGMLEYIASLRAAIDAKEIGLQVLRQQATPSNYDVIRLETELKGLREKLQQAESQEVSSATPGNVMIATSKMPGLGLEYLRLFREVKYQDGLYQVYCKLVELARLDHARETVVLQVVDRALPPQRKSRPKRLLITVVVGAFTFLGMIALAFLREHWKTAYQSEEELERLNRLRAYIQPWRNDARRIISKLKRTKTPPPR